MPSPAPQSARPRLVVMIPEDRLDAGVLRLEVAVDKGINSREHTVKFDDSIPTLTEALK